MKVAETKEEAHVYTIPLKVGKGIVRRRRANKAIKSIKEYVARHMDAKEEDVWIDAHLNEKIWGRGAQKIPSSVRVKAVKFEDELIEVSLPEK